MVNTGPSEPMSDDVLAPMRRIASAMSHVGSTVEKTAIASDSDVDRRRRAQRGETVASARNARGRRRDETSIAQAMKRRLPRRAITAPASTR